MSASPETINTTVADISSIFNEYTGKKQVATDILIELNERFITIKDGDRIRKGFRMDDGSEQIGLLSQCHSLQTLVSLAEDFGLSFNNANIIVGQKGTIRELMDIVIEDILETVCIIKDEDIDKGDHRFDNATGYIFDASPYNSSCFSEQFSNVDSITWVISSFLLILKHHAGVLHEVCKWEKALVDVIRYGIRYLNDAFIAETKDDVQHKALHTGWNFTKECREPSLYFSYKVCECYLDIYETFKAFLEYLHAERNRIEYYMPVDKALTEKFEAQKIKYNKDRNRVVDKSLREARHDEYNELARIYRLINDIDDYADLTINNTLYGDLEAKCRIVAQRVWELTKDDLAEKFFYNDLQNKLTEQEIRMSTTSDVLFNTTYIINILLCAGMDESLELEICRHNHLKEELSARKKQQEYDNLLESCLLAVQKAFRTYESLSNDGKDYIVDQFLIGFNEDFDGHKVAISELRKLRMRTFSLLPLLIHTNNKACEYLVKYPHYNMSKYHKNILDNRLKDKDGSVRWIWERDGFFSGSNYYYVLALKGFYDYYETYEEPYIGIGKDNVVREQRIRDAYERKLKSPDGEIGILEAANKAQKEFLDQRDNRIKELEEELKNVQRPVEDAVRDIVIDVLKEKFASTFADTLEYTSKVLSLDICDDTKDDNDATNDRINKALYNLFVTSMIRHFCEKTKDGRGNYLIKTPDEYKELHHSVDTDFSETILAYITNISDAADNKSNLLKLF